MLCIDVRASREYNEKKRCKAMTGKVKLRKEMVLSLHRMKALGNQNNKQVQDYNPQYFCQI